MNNNDTRGTLLKNLRTIQAAQYLGISVSFLTKMRMWGNGPIYSKLGSSVIYSTDDLDRYLESKRVTKAAKVAA